MQTLQVLAHVNAARSPHEENSIHQSTNCHFTTSHTEGKVCLMLLFGQWVSLFCAIGTCHLTFIATMFYLHKKSLLLSTTCVSLISFCHQPEKMQAVQVFVKMPNPPFIFPNVQCVEVIQRVQFKGASVTLHDHQALSALFKSLIVFIFILFLNVKICEASAWSLLRYQKTDCSLF